MKQQNNKVYSRLNKQMRYPKGLKEFIFNTTDYQTNKTLKISRFVSHIEMYEGKPLERIFGFLSTSKKRDKKSMLIKEVARNYDHKQWLGDVRTCYINGQKYPCYEYKDDSFFQVKGKWTFYTYKMTEPLSFLEENNIKYSGWDYSCRLGFFDYLTNYLDNNKCELLVKAGLGYWTKYIKYLDTTKKSLHEVFKIKQECTPLLKDEYFHYKELMTCRKYGYTTMKDIQTRIALNHMIRYNKNQYSNEVNEILLRDGTFKYLSLQENEFIIHDYIDYLKDLEKLGALSDNKELYPKDFNKAHKRANKKVKLAQSEKLIKGFLQSYKKHKKYEYQQESLAIIPVAKPDELYKESEKLNHCVRTYDKDVASGKTEIMFIRKTDHINKPYFTLELKKKKVIQVRGKENKNPNEQVMSFISDWARKFNIKYNPSTNDNYMYY